MTYRQIGHKLAVKHDTVFKAMKRFAERGVHSDERKHNGQNNPKKKINSELRDRLLDRNLLQRWSGLNLQ